MRFGAWFAMLPFWGVQLAAVVGVFALGWSWTGLALALALYAVRMFGLTAGYHRYFSHRAFKTSRWFQFALALLGASSTQKGPLWWAAHHRAHHKYSDTPRDIHSAKLHGFWWSHVEWILVRTYVDTDWERIKDLARYPELRWLNRYHLIPPVALAVTLFLVAGWWGVVWGFFVSNTLLWHGTFCVNSLAHVFGRRRYHTSDNSRNSFLIARSERQGFYWWEIDITHYILTVLSWLGLVWELHAPPREIRDARGGPTSGGESGALEEAAA